MTEEGIIFKTGVEVGKDITAQSLVGDNDAVLFTVGSTWPRGLPIPGEFIVIAWVGYGQLNSYCWSIINRAT